MGKSLHSFELLLREGADFNDGSLWVSCFNCVLGEFADFFPSSDLLIMLCEFGNDDYSYDVEFTYRRALLVLALESGLHSHYFLDGGPLHVLTFYSYIWLSRQSSCTCEDLCSALVSFCNDLEEEDRRGCTPFLSALINDNFYTMFNMMEPLIARGANIHAKSRDGQNAIHKLLWFSPYGMNRWRNYESHECLLFLSILSSLVEAGCDPNALDIRGLSPSDYARTTESSWLGWLNALRMAGCRVQRVSLQLPREVEKTFYVRRLSADDGDYSSTPGSELSDWMNTKIQRTLRWELKDHEERNRCMRCLFGRFCPGRKSRRKSTGYLSFSSSKPRSLYSAEKRGLKLVPFKQYRLMSPFNVRDISGIWSGS